MCMYMYTYTESHIHIHINRYTLIHMSIHICVK